MISSFPWSSTTENATCTGSSGEFCLVKWTSFTLRVSCSGVCGAMCESLLVFKFFLGTGGHVKRYPEHAQPIIQSTLKKLVDIGSCFLRALNGSPAES